MKKGFTQFPFIGCLGFSESIRKKIITSSTSSHELRLILFGLLLLCTFTTSFSQITTTSAPITADGDYAVPAGITKVDVECWGGGGGGGGANGSMTMTTERGGGGGAGGSFTRATSVTVAPGNVACTIGAGGTAGDGSASTNGGTGGTTTFASGVPVAAVGGAGGVTGTSTDDTGNGAPATTGTTHNGGAGANAPGTNPDATSGGGGGGGAGNGGAGGAGSGASGGTGGSGTVPGGAGGAGRTSTEGNGEDATELGGGGGGAWTDDNSDHDGGVGFRGQIIVSYTQATSSATYTKPVVKNGDSQTITITFSEALTGTPTITLTGGFATNAPMTDSGDQTTWTYTATTWTGNQTVTITVGTATGTTAGLGNVVFPTPTNNTFIIDNMAPTASAPINAAQTLRGGVTSTSNVQSTEAGVIYLVRNGVAASTQGEIDAAISANDAFVGQATAAAATPYTVTPGASLNFGVYDIVAVDAAGNVSPIVAGWLTVDNIQPTVVLNDDHPDAIVRDADNVIITAAFTENDAISGIPTITIAGLTPAVNNVPMSGGPLNWTYNWNVPAGNDGNHAVTISATDVAGNTNTAATAGTGPTSYLIDNIAPAIVLNDDHPDAFVRDADNIIITAVITELNGLVGTPAITIAGLAPAVNNVPMAGGPTTWTYNWNVPSGNDGAHAVTISGITDVAGNPSAPATAGTGQTSYTIDNVIPVISATAPTPGSSVSTTQVSYTLSEAVASGSITWTNTGGTPDVSAPHVQALIGSELTIGPHPNIVLTNNPTLVNGAVYTMAFNATDAAGNAAVTITNNNITFETATTSSIIPISSPVSISSLMDNMGMSANVLQFTIYDDGQDPIVPNIMTLHPNGVSQETITFSVREELTLGEGAFVSGFTSSNGSVVNARYTGKNSTNIITLTSNANGSWDASTTISYNAVTGNAVFVNLGRMQEIDAHPVSVATDNTQTFFSNGTFNVPAGVTSVTVEVWGGGGAGGSFNCSNGGGGGGGGGAYSRSLVAVTPLTGYGVVVGTGGTPISFNNGNPGGASTFGGTLVIAQGGSGGFQSCSTSGGVGGQAASGVGQVRFSGGFGGTGGFQPLFVMPGGGGGSSAGTGSNGNPGTSFPCIGCSPAPGGSAPPGGGSGGSGFDSGFGGNGIFPGGGGGGSGNTAGGFGAQGQVIVTYSLPAAGGPPDWNADSSPFKFSDLVITQGTGNSAALSNWQDIIAGAELAQGGNMVSGVVNTNNITFSAIPSISNTDLGYIDDAVGAISSKTYTLRIWLRDDLDPALAATVDNLFLAFRVDPTIPANITYNDVSNGQLSSRLVPTHQALESGANQISVVAQQLDFSTNPNPTQFVQQPIASPSGAPDFSIFPVVRARDENGNTDLNFGGTVTLSSAITLAPTAATMTNGVVILSAPQYQDAGNGLLTASTAGLTSGMSGAVTVNFSATSTIVAGAAAPLTTFSSLNTGSFVRVFDFIVREDNGGGGDGSPMRISQIVYTPGAGNDITNWSDAISQAALVDGLNPFITGTIGTNTITFSGINTAGLGFVGDNSTNRNFSLYITLKPNLGGTLPDDIDNKNFVFEVLDDNITLAPLSSLFTGSEAINSGSTNIAVDVDATKLQFDTNPATNLLLAKDISLQPPVPVVEALDFHNNRDLDYNSITVSTSNSGGLIMNNLPANNSIVNGLLTFPANFQFISGTGTNITLNVGATGPSAVSNAISTTFNVQPGVATTITSPSAPATISSLETNSGAPFTVFNFNVNDDPEPGTPDNNDDGLPTLISSVVITSNPANNSITNWTQAIAGARLESGAQGVDAVTISSNSITFSGIPTGVGTLGHVVDDATKTYSLKIYLNAAMIPSLASTIDGLQFEFQVLHSNVTLAANSTGFNGAQSATSGDNVVVDVDATTLRFLYPTLPLSASLDTSIPGISVEAVDVNNNRDLDFTGAGLTVTQLTNTVGATMQNFPGPGTQFGAGLLNFSSTFKYTSGSNGDDVTLTIRAGTGTTCGVNAICGTSPMITLQSSFESSIVADPTYAFSPTVAYVNHQEPSNIQNTATSLEIGRMLLVDGSRTFPFFTYGGLPFTTNTDNDGLPNNDQDGAGTALNSITIRISNPSNLRRIALYSAGVELGTEIDVTAIGAINDATPFHDFVFTGSPLLLAPDDNIVPISIRASFRGTAPQVTDGEALNIELISATLGTGSGFFNGPPAGAYIAGQITAFASPPGFNIINVLATKLDFVVQPAAFAGINRAVTVGSVEAHDQLGLIDTNFNSTAILSAAVPVNGSFAFASGVLDMSAMQYGNPGDGTLTVSAGGLTSDVNNTVGGLPNIAVQCQQVDVLHVTTSYTNGGPGGVVTSPNLVGGTSNKVVFGFKFNAPHTVTGPNHPLVNKFRITFSHPTAGVFLNMRVFESTSTVFSLGLPEVTTLGATYSQPTTNTLEVDFSGNPRDLVAEPDLSYFLMVDIDINATGSTPQMTISVVDDNVDSSPTDNNILVSNGTSFSNTFGPDAFTFAATFPPSLTSSYPAVGQSNVDPNQPQLELTFSVPVFTLDNQVRLHNKVSGVTTVLTAANGQFMGGAGTVAQPIIFTIPPGTLVADTEYYVTIAQGNRTNLTGIMDDSENLFPGISFSGTLFFKTSDFTPPKLLGPLTTPSSSSGPTVTNITSTGATLNATFDKKGRAYFMVLATNSAPPTNDQIKGTVPYVASPVISRGDFLVNSTNPVSQFGNMVPLSGTFAAGTHYVWMYAEAFVENDHVQTPIPTTDPYGAAPTFAIAGTGPTLTFVAPALTTGPITLNLPNINLCNNSYQILNAPIIISEGANSQFFAGGTQTINLVLPANFQFDVTLIAGTTPQYGTLTLQGSDFVPGSGQLGFLGNSILTITYRNNNTLSRDKIIISGLRVIASSSFTGPIFRLGGNALPSIIDGQPVATLSSFNAPFIEFDNSYSTNVWMRTQATAIPSDPTTKVVTAIPDNTQPQTVELTPYIPPNSSDFGPSSFSGTGVNVNILNLSAATLDVPFNITITHTDQNGCISNNAVQYLVYDHNAGVNITDAMDNADQGPYCSTNTNFVIDAINSPVYGQVVRKIDYDNLPSHFMETVTADIPTSADPLIGPPTQIINKTDFGGAWIPIIQGLPKLAPNLPPPDENPKNIGGILYRSYTFDEAEILDANAISGGVIPDPYSNFRQVTPFQGNTYYTGGSLGLIEFTGTYRNSSNTTVQVPRRQLVEVFLPAVPIVEVGLGNQPVSGTPIYCQYGGPIAINGYPAALAGTSKGRFTLTDVVSGTVIYDVPPVGAPTIPVASPPGSAFVDNGNGTATLDPSQLTNGYQSIRITYTFQDDDSPCESSGYYDIQITPNPVAAYTTGLLCEDVDVQFTDQSTISNPGTFNIVGWSWNFGDPNSAANTSTVQNPMHLYDQPGTFPGVSLQAQSNLGCLSTNPLNLADPNTVEATSQDLIVGGTPSVSFNYSGVSTADDMTFNSTSGVFANSTIATVNWNFGDGTPVEQTANLVNVLHQYTAPGIYDVNAFVTSGLGCTDDLTQQIVMVDKFTPTDAVAYEEDFEVGDGGWQLVAEPGFGGTVSWAWGAPSTSVITNPINGTNVWTTNLSGSYSPLERSYLYTTCFDLTQLLRPMISFNSMVQLAAADGVVIEYSTDIKNIADPTKVWTLLGDFNLSQSTGVDWYNALGLASKPGNQVTGDYGWSGSDNNQWMESKHILDEINIPTPQADVVFRFGLASVNTSPSLDGFAMDNIRVGNRTRTIVVENFTNKANPLSGPGGETREKFESDNLKVFNPGGVGTKLVKINYHVGFPATDPFNMDNPADPSSRALYYNITETPLARLDGFKNPGPQEAFFSTWGTEQYGIRTLQLAQAELTFNVTNSADGSLQVDVQVNPKIDLDANTRLHVAILEKNIPIGQLSPSQSAFIATGETDFEFVLKKMLPSALGTRFDQVAPAGQVRDFGPFNWYPEKARMYGPNDDLAVIVFLQNEDTREILQSEILEDIPDPPLLTGLERDNTSIEHVAVYPNPADHEINIELPAPAVNRIRVLMASQLGVITGETAFEPGQQSAKMDTRDLAAGIYFLQLGDGKNATRKKVMIVHK